MGRKWPRWEAQEHGGVFDDHAGFIEQGEEVSHRFGTAVPSTHSPPRPADPSQPHRRDLWVVRRGLGEARLLPKAALPGRRGGGVRGPCWPPPGPAPWPRAGSTRPGRSRGCASAAAWGRCAGAASRCPGTRRCSGSRRDLGRDAGKGGAGPGEMPGVQSDAKTPSPLRGRGRAARLTLGDELLLELLQELQVEQVVGRERLFPHHRLHRLHVLPDGVAGVLRDGRAAVRTDRQTDAPCSPPGRQSRAARQRQPALGRLPPGCVTPPASGTPRAGSACPG